MSLSFPRFISVFKGSIFETINAQPTVLLKLMYHWSCQTHITVRETSPTHRTGKTFKSFLYPFLLEQNVIQWVKVNQTVVDMHFRNFRCLVIASVHVRSVQKMFIRTYNLC